MDSPSVATGAPNGPPTWWWVRACTVQSFVCPSVGMDGGAMQAESDPPGVCVEHPMDGTPSLAARKGWSTCCAVYVHYGRLARMSGLVGVPPGLAAIGCSCSAKIHCELRRLVDPCWDQRRRVSTRMPFTLAGRHFCGPPYAADVLRTASGGP